MRVLISNRLGDDTQYINLHSLFITKHFFFKNEILALVGLFHKLILASELKIDDTSKITIDSNNHRHQIFILMSMVTTSIVKKSHLIRKSLRVIGNNSWTTKERRRWRDILSKVSYDFKRVRLK